MKQFYYFLTANLLLWVCSLFLTSCEKEDVPPPIDLNTLCKTFQRQQLQLYVNGVEYFGHTVTFAQNKTTDVENNSSTMFLGISPLWPNVRNYTSSEEYDYEWIEMPVSTPGYHCEPETNPAKPSFSLINRNLVYAIESL